MKATSNMISVKELGEEQKQEVDCSSRIRIFSILGMITLKMIYQLLQMEMLR